MTEQPIAAKTDGSSLAASSSANVPAANVRSAPFAARYVLGIIILAAIYFLSGKFGLSLAFINASASAIWPPTGIALSALLLFGKRLWPGVFIGAFLVNITTQGSLLTTLAIATGNTLEALCGAWLVQKFAGGAKALERMETVFRFLAFAVLLSTIISATIGVTTLCLGGFANWNQYFPLWLTWWLGDVVSNLVVAPLLIIWITQPALSLKPRQVVELLALFLVILAVSQLVFPYALPILHRNNPTGYLMLLPVVWAAFRFGKHGAVTAAFLSSALALWGTLHGFGPFLQPNPNQSLLFVQAFIGTITATALVLAAVISEREQARQSQARLAAIVESSDDAIVTRTLDGIIRSWNAGAERLFGFREPEIIGQPILRIIPPELLQEEEQILERLRRGEPISHYETVRIARDGRRIDVSLSISPLRDGSGHITGVSKIIRDITERKKAQEALRQASAELERRVEQRTSSLTEALSELEAFSYSLSHDMRAPLRAIRSFTSIVLSDHSPEIKPEGREYLEKVIRAAQRLDQLILDVLALARVSQQALKLEPVDLTELIQSLIQERPELQPPRAEVHIDPPLYPVLAHEASLTQCLTNLLGNAVKFVAPGVQPHIRVRAELLPATMGNGAPTSKIRTDSVGSGNEASSDVPLAAPKFVRLWVEDNGIGIDKETQSRLFGMFERGAHTKRYEGTGIGLAIVRKAVERMGGTVGLESEPGGGSRFWLQLPHA